MQNVKVTGKGKKNRNVPPRIFFLLARNAPIAVVFRRGPSKWVQIIKWNTQTDKFEYGQWFHGQMYERRCDLSPDGSLLVYFCAKWSGRRIAEAEQMLHKESTSVAGSPIRTLLKGRPKTRNQYTYAWTAVSKPPFLTALALWPKGDCWHGGGLFKSNKRLWLNHKPDVSIPHRNHLPVGLCVEPNPNACGEDDPIYSMRLEREGWILKQKWQTENRGYPDLFRTLQSEIREKLSPDRKQALRLIRSVDVLDYSEEFTVSSASAPSSLKMVRVNWADWDQQGRLVFARSGKIFAAELNTAGEILERELIDLNGLEPAPMQSPSWASKW
jgi:hypothetical protein